MSSNITRYIGTDMVDVINRALLSVKRVDNAASSARSRLFRVISGAPLECMSLKNKL